VTGNVTYNATLWGVRVTIVAVEIQQHVPFVWLLTYVVAVINIKALIVVMEMQQWASFAVL
jgi:hypothetical protein